MYPDMTKCNTVQNCTLQSLIILLEDYTFNSRWTISTGIYKITRCSTTINERNIRHLWTRMQPHTQHIVNWVFRKIYN